MLYSTVPGLVTGFTANEINFTAISVEWSRPSDPNGIIIIYEVEYTIENVSSSENFTAGQEESYTIVLGGLEEFSTYSIRVRAYTSQGAGNYTTVIPVRTDPAAASPPTNVRTTVSKTYILLEWSTPSRPAGDIEGYYISSNATPPSNLQTSTLTNVGSVLNVSVNILSVNFIDLSPFTLYDFSVAAYSFLHADENNNFTIILGTFSALIVNRTLQDAPTPPRNFTLTQIPSSPSTLEADWDDPSTLNGILTNYSIFCRTSSTQFYSEQLSSDYQLVNTTVPSQTNVTITGLDPFTRYECYVTASTEGGESENSNNSSAITDEAIPSGPPRGFAFSAVTATSVSMEWSRPLFPNGVISQYIFQYSNDSINFTVPILVEFVNDEYNVTNITVTYLNEFTNYTFNLSAVTGGGTGPSVSIRATTNEAG